MSRLWTFLNSKPLRVLGTLIVAILGLYGTFFYERKPELSIEVLSSASVLDVRERLTKLTIVFDGTDLRATNQHLHLLTLRFRNSGAADILKSSFDDDAPLGFLVSGGKIVEQPSVSGDAYLRARLQPIVKNDHAVLFAPVILNAGDAFDVRVLLLVPEGTQPKVSALGKLVGVRKIEVIAGDVQNSAAGYFDRAFVGDWKVQLGRVVAYTIAFIVALIALTLLVAYPTVTIAGLVSKALRRRKLRRYRKEIGRLSLKEEYLATQFEQATPHYSVFEAIVRGERFPLRHFVSNVGYEGSVIDLPREGEGVYDDLTAAGLIVRDGPITAVSEDFVEAAKRFVAFMSDNAKRGRTEASKTSAS